MNLWHLFLAFFRASILSYGGGPASIPLMQSQVVDVYHWFTPEQFADALAMGNTLPGPIAPKMAAYVGYSVARLPGAIVGVAATVVPTAVLIVLLAQLLLTFKNSPRIIGLLKVAKPLVVVLLIQTTWELATNKSFPNAAAYVVSALGLLAVIFLKINPAWVMLTGVTVGFIFYKWF